MSKARTDYSKLNEKSEVPRKKSKEPIKLGTQNNRTDCPWCHTQETQQGGIFKNHKDRCKQQIAVVEWETEHPSKAKKATGDKAASVSKAAPWAITLEHVLAWLPSCSVEDTATILTAVLAHAAKKTAEHNNSVALLDSHIKLVGKHK